MPRDNLEIASDISSFADASGVDSLLGCLEAGRYGSPARTAFAYSFASKAGEANRE